MSDEPINVNVQVQEVEPINIDVHLADYNNVQDEIDTINTHLGEVDETLQNHKDRLDGIDNSLESISSSITDINDTLRTHGTDIEDIKTAIQGINRSINQIQSEMPNSSIVLEADYIDGTSEQIEVATYEDQST